MSDDFPTLGSTPPAGLPEWEWGDDLCAPFVELLAVSGASISVFRQGGDHATVCTSDPLAQQLDAMQFGLGEGPRWVVARTGRPSISADVAHESHPDWPVFADAIATLGVGALFAFPIMTGPIMIGVVDLYRRTPGPLAHEVMSQALALSRKVAAAAVQEAVRAAAEHDGADPRASVFRREVHQAVGMVFVQMDITTIEALALLRAYAFSTARPLQDVARDVVARRIDFRDLPD